MSAIHIGFPDYTLFKECPEFYVAYKLINAKYHHVYSDNFILSVVDLSQIDLTTEEDRKYHIDYWASLFKASTWEDIRMLASKNEYLNEASKTIFQLGADEQIRKRCRDREEYYQDLRNYEREIEKMRKTISEKDAAISEKDAAILEKDAAISKKDAAIIEKDSIIEELLAEIRELKN